MNNRDKRLSSEDLNEYCRKLCEFEDQNDFSGALEYIDAIIKKYHLTEEEERAYKDEIIRRRNEDDDDSVCTWHLCTIRPPKTHIDQFRADRKEILEKMTAQRSNQ